MLLSGFAMQQSPPAERRRFAHTLKGSARGIGAWRLARRPKRSKLRRPRRDRRVCQAALSCSASLRSASARAASPAICAHTSDRRRIGSAVVAARMRLACTSASHIGCARAAASGPSIPQSVSMPKITYIDHARHRSHGRGRDRLDRHGNGDQERRPRHRGGMRRRLRLRDLPRLCRRGLAREGRRAVADGRGHARFRLSTCGRIRGCPARSR